MSAELKKFTADLSKPARDNIKACELSSLWILGKGIQGSELFNQAHLYPGDLWESPRYVSTNHSLLRFKTLLALFNVNVPSITC